MDESVIAFKDEVLLLRWGDNSRDGMTVTFQLPGEYETHPFKNSPSGKKTGQRYAAVLVEINDDETPVVQAPKGGALSREAAGLCKNERFQDFVTGRLPYKVYPGEREDPAVNYLREYCAIDSRAELDHNPLAASLFAKLKREFLEWRQ